MDEEAVEVSDGAAVEEATDNDASLPLKHLVMVASGRAAAAADYAQVTGIADAAPLFPETGCCLCNAFQVGTSAEQRLVTALKEYQPTQALKAWHFFDSKRKQLAAQQDGSREVLFPAVTHESFTMHHEIHNVFDDAQDPDTRAMALILLRDLYANTKLVSKHAVKRMRLTACEGMSSASPVDTVMVNQQAANFYLQCAALTIKALGHVKRINP